MPMNTQGSDETTLPDSLKIKPIMDASGFKSVSDLSRAEDSLKTKPDRSVSGLLRHKASIGACLSLSLLVIPLSTINLGALSKQEAELDSAFRVKPVPAKPDLPDGFSYLAEQGYSEGFIPVSKIAWTGLRCGFADQQGRVVIEPKFSWVGEFKEGLAPAATTDKSPRYGYVDKTGAWVIKPQYTSAESFENGYASVGSSNRSVAIFIDKHGRHIFETLGSATRQGNLVWRWQNQRVGLCNLDGKWVLPQKYDSIVQLSETSPSYPMLSGVNNQSPYFLISQDGMKGIADFSGKVLLQPSQEEISSFHDGCAATKMNGKFGFVNASGKIIIEPKYDRVSQFDDLIAVQKGQHWQVINKKGKVIPTPHFDKAFWSGSGKWLGDGYAMVVVGNKCGYIDSNGRMAIAPQYELATGFEHGHALVWNGTVWRFIDKNGAYVSPPLAEVRQLRSDSTSVALPGPLYSFLASKDLESARFAADRLKQSIEGDPEPVVQE